MKVEVVTPEDYMGDVIGDLNSRRGQMPVEPSRAVIADGYQCAWCRWPICSVMSTHLRSMSQGRAQYTMQFDHYEQVPQVVSDEVRAKIRLSNN